MMKRRLYNNNVDDEATTDEEVAPINQVERKKHRPLKQLSMFPLLLHRMPLIMMTMMMTMITTACYYHMIMYLDLIQLYVQEGRNIGIMLVI